MNFFPFSVIYNEHTGWYSFVLGSTYGFLLTFGFIMMTPQLFINYKLKSVAHLPWRMMTYKALNTFIDDIFAFVIKMPTMYRIGCFRDDIVFFIFLYQRYIYRVSLFFRRITIVFPNILSPLFWRISMIFSFFSGGPYSCQWIWLFWRNVRWTIQKEKRGHRWPEKLRNRQEKLRRQEKRLVALPPAFLLVLTYFFDDV